MSPRRRSEAPPRSDLETLKRQVVAHYERQLQRFGATARGMDWKDEASQRLRFAILCELADLRGKSVCEIGAGAGHLVDFLSERGIEAAYSGIDLSEAMVDAARLRHPDVPFEHKDILRETSESTYDAVLCSGLFHVKLDRDEQEWGDFVRQNIRGMYAMCREGIAFNLMSDQVDFRNPGLYYANPGEMLDFCRKELSRFVVLRHDYPLYEFTVYVYRSTPVT